MMLTEENLRLKRLLEEQRMIDAKDQKEYQQRIVDEEKRRQEILTNIEKARKEREDRKNAIATGLQAEKEARMHEIERLKLEHVARNKDMS